MPVLGRGGSSPPSRTKFTQAVPREVEPPVVFVDCAMSVDSGTIEHMFESVPSSVASPRLATSREATLGALRQKIRRLEPQQMPSPVLPVMPGIDTLFPEGGLKTGVAYTLPSHTSVMWALIARATTQGHWVASVGNDHLGFVAAAEYGVNTDRLLVVPRIDGWWSVVSALVDVVSIVVFRPQGPLPPPQARETLLARARERGATLLVCGDWPGAHASISVEETRWSGLSDGHGLLVSQRLTLLSKPRHGGQPHRVTLVRDGDGIRVDHDDLTPVRHLTPRVKEAATAEPNHREAG